MKNPIITALVLKQRENDLLYINEIFKYGQVKAKDVKFLIPESDCLITVYFHIFGRMQTILFTKIVNAKQLRIDNFDEEFEKIENCYIKKIGILEGYFILDLY